MKNYGAKFCQSLYDFPCTVELGKKAPTWGINRWRDSLRFFPPDDEGYSLRGNRQQLLYKGRRRSHRFTILNDGAFEYDCILKKEPENNIISLQIEGAEKFDFFRQPDFVPDDFLKGSYAVYKKETLNDEGTGKLCHINRPLIIDARGRKVWGELVITGNELHITIPEQWLAEAKYPVVVDPTLGTTTVGSQNKWISEPGEYPSELYIEMGMIVNRFIVYDPLNSLCTAYFYTDKTWEECGGRAIICNDIGAPYQIKSSEENFINFEGGSPGWRSGTFISGSFVKGSYVWFGLHSEYMWYPRFDYGSICYWAYCDDYKPRPSIIPIDDYYSYCDFKLSMYFTYTNNQAYIRTITQGVSLTDISIRKINYKRSLPQTTKINEIENTNINHKRNMLMNVDITTETNILISFLRKILINVSCNSAIQKISDFVLQITDIIFSAAIAYPFRNINKYFHDNISIYVVAKRSQGFYKWLKENIINIDYSDYNVLFLRTVKETKIITDTFDKLDYYFRGLHIEAGNTAETVKWGDYHRDASDLVQIKDFSLRHLIIFIRLATVSFIRDFVIKRFLVAREELALKSCITREITLESKIN